MFRIGRTIRSAKMKATTPPKLMPPFHSTAASGMLPTEQTKEITATSGPTTGPHNVARTGCSVRKKDCQNVLGTQAVRAPAINSDVHPDGSPIHDEIVADGGETVVGCHPLPQRPALGDGHVHFGVAFHAA